MNIFTKFRKLKLSYKIVVISLFSFLFINNIIFYIQPFTSNAIFEYYTTGYFSLITSLQHILFGFIPFSVGDVIYIGVGIFLLINIIRFVIALLLFRLQKLIPIVINTFAIFMIIWLLLGSQWNWNYLQPSLDEKLKLETYDYKVEELVNFTYKLIAEATINKNNSNFDIFNNDTISIIDISYLGYKALAEENDFYKYKYPSVKYSLLSPILPFIGISGYYNPFTAEAQITKGMPIVLIPYVANHEIAHQLGIASESEANFIGYLASINNPLSTVKYSGNLRLLMYCLSELRYRKYENYEEIKKSISPKIKKDINEIYSYWDAHQSVFNRYQSIIYDKFLKSNNQKDGLNSYNKVVSLAIFYNRKK